VYPFQEPLPAGLLDFIEHIFGDVYMTVRETLVSMPGTGDELDREGAAPELTVKLVRIRPQVMGSCAGVDPVLSENQEHRAPAARHEARQEDDESYRFDRRRGVDLRGPVRYPGVLTGATRVNRQSRAEIREIRRSE
jgi:hypothetical protein